MAYGGINPNAANIVFPFDRALPAARDLWALAERITTLQGQRGDRADHARIDWKGPHRTTFDTHMGDEVTDTTAVASGLQRLANDLASQWAAARGEQNRLNWARWVQAEIEDDGWGENLVENFTGEDDYGDPPANPAPPGAPGFAETVSVLYPEYGP